MTLKFIDLHLNPEEQGENLSALMQKYASNINYVFHLSANIEPVFIQHGQTSCATRVQNTEFIVRKGQNNFLYLLRLFYDVKKLQPDVVLLHGFLKPHRILILRWILGKHVRMLLQNHGDQPQKGLRGFFQKLAARRLHGFLFVSKLQAEPWMQKYIITNVKKVFTLMEGSTTFQYAEKLTAKKMLDLPSTISFLWVGRLDKNKDPLAVVSAFGEYFQKYPDHRLYMVYGTDDLLSALQQCIRALNISQQVILLGSCSNDQVMKYMQAADYFVLGSHHEGSGYALCEALACGTVPIVTNIPSFKQMCNDELFAYLFEPGNSDNLKRILFSLNVHDWQNRSTLARNQFEKALSFQAIGNNLSEIILSLGLVK